MLKKIIAYIKAKKEKRRRRKVARFMKNHALGSYFIGKQGKDKL